MNLSKVETLCPTHQADCKVTFHVLNKEGTKFTSIIDGVFPDHHSAKLLGNAIIESGKVPYIQERHFYRYKEQFHNPSFEPVSMNSTNSKV